MMRAQVPIHLLVSFHYIVNEPFIWSPTPGFARAQFEPEPKVFPIRNGPFLPCTVAFPVKAAAGVNDPFGLKVCTVKQIPNEGIGIVEFRICSNDDAGPWRGPSGDDMTELGQAHYPAPKRHHEQRQPEAPTVCHIKIPPLKFRDWQRYAEDYKASTATYKTVE
jgi:hypothetical protein